tara:strand:+ start:1524 stop:1919 length:396 start_codon:yes stop_codon:yes gene_type:complete
MPNFSEKITNFLDRHGKDPDIDVTKKPTSASMLRKGDIVIFDYMRIQGLYTPQQFQTMGLLVNGPVNCAKTGNRLISVVKIPTESVFQPEQLEDLYKNRSLLAENDYRTYILSLMINIYKIEASTRGDSLQ